MKHSFLLPTVSDRMWNNFHAVPFLFLFMFSSFLMTSTLFSASRRENTPPPPGIVIAASPDWEKLFYGTPSMEIMEDGTYVFTHDWFGPASKGERTFVYQSTDQGKSWTKVSEFPDQKSGSLFRLGNTLYHIGFYRPGKKGMSNECIAIRRSDDMGRTWTHPVDSRNGLLCSDDRYYSDPVPVLVHDGRVYWQIDRFNPEKKNWPPYDTLVISAPDDSDLLNASNWTRSNDVKWDENWPYRGWLEGNCVKRPDGNVSVLLRVEDWHCPGGPGKHAARIDLSKDGRKQEFVKFLNQFPGGHSKFCIRFDEVSRKYWALTNWIQPNQKGARNTLALVCSDDLDQWEVRQIVYQHPDGINGFQYVDWRFVGNDIHFVCRLGWFGKNMHDSNYMIFDTVKDFRNSSREKDAPPLGHLK
ncbi:MAG: exo-alpha-sialidase [Planctomycetaceae bacterium]|nr:exo-alpha-sialidase [Planctomycetaceae bacterium]